jgi:hypothetical protein
MTTRNAGDGWNAAQRASERPLPKPRAHAGKYRPTMARFAEMIRDLGACKHCGYHKHAPDCAASPDREVTIEWTIGPASPARDVPTDWPIGPAPNYSNVLAQISKVRDEPRDPRRPPPLAAERSMAEWRALIAKAFQ